MSIENDVPKVQVTLLLGFDDNSEKALHLTWEVAQEILEEYGVWVEIIPIHIWIHDPTGIQQPDLPCIEINGRTMFIGRVPDKEELIDVILSRVFNKEVSGEHILVVAARNLTNRLFMEGAIV